MSRADLCGKKFGRATVIELSHRKNGKAQWRCQCDCGSEFVADGYNLKSGNTSSCGCVRVSVSSRLNLKTGLSHSPEYDAHQNMRRRCYDPENARYQTYGARGITVCQRWLGECGFENFLADMGRKPGPAYTIERSDNNVGYEPGNCRWATRAEQARNKTTNIKVELNGERVTLAEACRTAGVKYPTALYRYHRGLPWGGKVGQQRSVA